MKRTIALAQKELQHQHGKNNNTNEKKMTTAVHKKQ
jgi:hypothetical protein